MKFYILKFSKDYSDEFDVYGVSLYTEDELAVRLARVEKLFDGGNVDSRTEFYFGTNEYLTFHDFMDFQDSYDAVEVSETFATEFEATVGKSFGNDFIEMVIEGSEE